MEEEPLTFGFALRDLKANEEGDGNAIHSLIEILLRHRIFSHE